MPQDRQFTKSKVSHLYRHRAGRYYAIAKVGGKVRRKCLDTDDYNIAQQRLASALTELRGSVNASKAGSLREAIEAETKRNDPNIKPATRHYYQQIAASLIETSDRMPARPLDKRLTRVILSDLRGLMDQFAEVAAPTRYNGALALLRRVYDRAIEAQQVGDNLPHRLKRMKVVDQDRWIPNKDQFAAIVESIEAQGKVHSRSASAAVRLLASTGLRISEAQSLRWRDINGKVLVVRTAKNDIARRVPLTRAAVEVLTELREMLPSGDDDPVMPIKSPRLALERACQRLSYDHLRVHDLRHCFATRCIEAGVDLPTIAAWLGHKDKGQLAARIYGHLIESHSEQQIGKVEI